MKYFQSFRVTGVANTITYDAGLKSTESEIKRLNAVHVQLSGYSRSDDNDVQGWHERAKVFDLPEQLVPTQKTTDEYESSVTPRSLKIPVDIDLPAGEIFKAAIKCAATSKDLRGVYEYEII